MEDVRWEKGEESWSNHEKFSLAFVRSKRNLGYPITKIHSGSEEVKYKFVLRANGNKK